jgi:hypothetical protein
MKGKFKEGRTPSGEEFQKKELRNFVVEKNRAVNGAAAHPLP